MLVLCAMLNHVRETEQRGPRGGCGQPGLEQKICLHMWGTQILQNGCQAMAYDVKRLDMLFHHEIGRREVHICGCSKQCAACPQSHQPGSRVDGPLWLIEELPWVL